MEYINIEKIEKFIDSIECISNIRKNFYKQIIEQRYDILKEVYENIKELLWKYGIRGMDATKKVLVA